MKSMTFTELDNLEKETEKGQSKNLKEIVTSAEKIILCEGEFTKVLWTSAVYYFVLTDYRLLAKSVSGFTNIMLDKIVNVEIKHNLGGTIYIYIGVPEYSAEVVGSVAHTEKGINYSVVLFGDLGIPYQTRLADELKKNISEAKIRLRSNTVNVKTSQQDGLDIVGQLEKLASLYNSGAITQSEYNKAKEKLLSS